MDEKIELISEWPVDSHDSKRGIKEISHTHVTNSSSLRYKTKSDSKEEHTIPVKKCLKHEPLARIALARWWRRQDESVKCKIVGPAMTNANSYLRLISRYMY